MNLNVGVMLRVRSTWVTRVAAALLACTVCGAPSTAKSPPEPTTAGANEPLSDSAGDLPANPDADYAPPERARGLAQWKQSLHCPDGAAVTNVSDDRIGCARPDGTEHGPVTRWRDDVLVEWYVHKDGPYDGLAARYHPNGTKAWQGAYRDGKQHGPWNGWHDDGKQHYEQVFRAGTRHGRFRQWYGDGKLQWEGTYSDDRPIGLFRYFHENGQMKSEVDHGTGEGEHSIVEWDENGTKREQGSYHDELKVGTWRTWDGAGRLATEHEYNAAGGLYRVTRYENGKVVERLDIDPPQPPSPRH